MKKYKYRFPTKLYVITSVAAVAVTALSIFNILRLAEVGDLFSFNRPLDITSIVLCALILTALILVMIFSSYEISEKGVTLNMVIVRRKLLSEDLLMIRQERATKTAALYFRVPKGKTDDSIGYVVICVKPNETEDFIKDVTDYNPHVMVDYFDLK